MNISRCFSHPAAAIALLVMAAAPQPERPEGVLQVTTCAVIGDRVFFDIGSTELRPDAMYIIISAVDFYSAYPAEITLQGHTDDHFPEEKGEEVGWLRAEAVRDAFIARGYPFELIHTASYGDKRPAVLGENEDAWSQNRRVVILVENYLIAPPEPYCGDG